MNEPSADGQGIAAQSDQLPAKGSDYQDYLQAATSDNTRRAYRNAVHQFIKWGGLLPATAESVRQYLTDQAQRLNPRSLDLHVTALSQWHVLQALPDPTESSEVRKVMQGIHRRRGKPLRQAEVFDLDELQQMIDALPWFANALKAYRDRAILLVGFFGVMRRSEIASIDVSHIKQHERGYIVTLPRSKTDQVGGGIDKEVPRFGDALCPATALDDWLSRADIQRGAVFRRIDRWGNLQGSKSLHGASVNQILKAAARRAGLNAEAISGHSFRRSFVTAAFRQNADIKTVMSVGNWSSYQTVYRYKQQAQALQDNPGFDLVRSHREKIDEGEA